MAEWQAKSGLPHTRYISAPTGVIPGPTSYTTARISTLRSSFDLFLTDKIIQLLVDMTYSGDVPWRSGERSMPQKYRRTWGCFFWPVCTGQEINHHGPYSEPPCPIVSSINSHVRFDDRLTRPAHHREDKLAAFCTIWEKWTHRLSLLFNLGRDICVDEQLVPFKGCCVFRQYMPNKPAKYGIKIWVTCDIGTSYAWRMQIYTGKPSGAAVVVNHSKRVVLDMKEGLQGNTVTCDNFFTTYSLAEELLKRKMALVRTIRKTKPELPPQLLKTRRRAIFSSLFAFTKTHTALSYIPRRGEECAVAQRKAP
ncbi:uncharacterized protein LOC122869536 [Siniperca chuatsi]|uniref:uncharacterized protein LOC122869536 n=1 Tax=Siniperca chuatsi TaxID=119488 RepID=UPI001CE18339|nr:uncharacterized protein LOC122869536 [Siniperca chuatsi]